MGLIKLKPGDLGKIIAALESTYAGPINVNQLLQLIVDNTPEIANQLPVGAQVNAIVYSAVMAANRQGVLDRLLVAAAAQRANRPDLRGVVMLMSTREGWRVPVGMHDLTTEGLEQLTSSGNPFLNIAQLSRWMLAVENVVCQVRCGDGGGTGFLVGPDLVLTNYHVVQKHLEGHVAAEDVAVRFDYRVSPSGAAPSDALPWEPINADWKIPNSPHSAADVSLEGEPEPHKLDYALLKLKSRAGEQVLPGGEPRSWVDISVDRKLPSFEAPIFIVQHPGQPPKGTQPQQPLKITFATPGFESANANMTRVAYKPSTLKGSSGSPVFGPEYTCVALHHNRGQISPDAKNPKETNRGIPLSTIRSHLQEAIRAQLKAPPG